MSEVEKPREPFWRLEICELLYSDTSSSYASCYFLCVEVVSTVMLRKMKDSAFTGLILVKIHMEGGGGCTKWNRG